MESRNLSYWYVLGYFILQKEINQCRTKYLEGIVEMKFHHYGKYFSQKFICTRYSKWIIIKYISWFLDSICVCSTTIYVSVAESILFFKNILDFLGIPHISTITFGMTTWWSYENSMSYCSLKAKQNIPFRWIFRNLYTRRTFD